MRKTTETTALALFNFKEIKMGNSEVKVKNLKLNEPDNYYVCSYFLHGNEIARFNGINLNISDGGYQSETTKERLNGILEYAYQTGAHPYYCFIFQSNWKWYFGMKRFPTDNSVIKYTEYNLMKDVTGFIHLSNYSFHSDKWQFIEEL